LFDDLEQQAEGLALVERDAEVAEQVRVEYAGVDLESRVHGSVGRVVTLSLDGGLTVRGEIARAGRGWCLVCAEPREQAGQGEWVVNLALLTGSTGLGPRAVAAEARGVAARLGLGSVLRRLMESREPVVLVRSDGVRVRGRVARAGADFVEIVSEADGLEVVALRALAALRRP